VHPEKLQSSKTSVLLLPADRYQGGAKPAWILEIEEARATSTGAIGQSEAWAGNTRQQQQQQEEEEEHWETQKEMQKDRQQDEQLVMEKNERREDERQKVEVEEKAEEREKGKREWEIEGEKDAEEGGEGKARRDDGAAVRSTAAAEHIVDEPVTSQQQPACSDVIHDLGDVSSGEREHVTGSHDYQQRESASASGCGKQASIVVSGAERGVDEAMTPPPPPPPGHRADAEVTTRLHAAVPPDADSRPVPTHTTGQSEHHASLCSASCVGCQRATARIAVVRRAAAPLLLSAE